MSIYTCGVFNGHAYQRAKEYTWQYSIFCTALDVFLVSCGTALGAARGALHPWPSQSLGFADLQIDWQSQSAITIPSGNTEGKPWCIGSWICSWLRTIDFQIPNIGASEITNNIIISVA